jgi:hypothetical protein
MIWNDIYNSLSIEKSIATHYSHNAYAMLERLLTHNPNLDTIVDFFSFYYPKV